MGFSRQEHRSGLPFAPPRDLPKPGIKPETPCRFFTTQPPGEAINKPLTHLKPASCLYYGDPCPASIIFVVVSTSSSSGRQLTSGFNYPCSGHPHGPPGEGLTRCIRSQRQDASEVRLSGGITASRVTKRRTVPTQLSCSGAHRGPRVHAVK